jgi:UDP-glucose 4-epimerase
MMSLDEAVDLVLYAFKNGSQGDLFVQKSPASTIGDLAQAMKEIFKSPSEIHTIGTRHGEKLFETLLTKEEFHKAEDMGEYYRVPADNRDLNYGKYFKDGNVELSSENEYHSHNTRNTHKPRRKGISSCGCLFYIVQSSQPTELGRSPVIAFRCA